MMNSLKTEFIMGLIFLVYKGGMKFIEFVEFIEFIEFVEFIGFIGLIELIG